MRCQRALGCLLAGSFLLTACPGEPPPPPPPPPPVGLCDGVTPVKGTAIELQEIASGFDDPVYLISPPGDLERLFIVEREGRIKIIKDGQTLATPFLDISAQVETGFNEQGLLSMAFHPDFAKNGKFYISYTAINTGESTISELVVSQDNPDVADPTSEREILTQVQPFDNHNGGLIKFGPDGFLYIGLGDGGSANDPQGNAQDLSTRLGKLLRIDVNKGNPFSVPADNPFVGQKGALPEIWDFGLRNPWRYSFDRETGDLYIGDVGQDAREEVDFAPAGQGGQNWGWSAVEGVDFCVNDPNCAALGSRAPITEYEHSEPNVCAVAGGYVYRGCALPDLHGTYFFGDTCAGFVSTLQVVDGVAQNEQKVFQDGTASQLVSFGEDTRGELYLVLLTGQILKVVPAGQ